MTITSTLPELAAGLWRLGPVLPGHEASEQGGWYEAEHALSPGEKRAVWLMHPGPEAATQILGFGELTTELSDFSHPLIVMPDDSGFTACGRPFLVMKQAGHAQRLLSAARSMPLAQRLGLLLLICEALQELHLKGYAFGAIEDAMVGLDAYGQAQLMGLNLRRLADSPAPLLAQEADDLCRLLRGMVPGLEAAAPQDEAAALPAPAQSALDAIQLKAMVGYASSEALAEDLRACLAELAAAPEPSAAQESARPALRKAAITLAQTGLAALLVFGAYVQANDPLKSLLVLDKASAEPIAMAAAAESGTAPAAAGLSLRFMDLGMAGQTSTPSPSPSP